MVKKKKTVEELLNEALVPVEEQPYEVPENWVWASLKSINSSKKRGFQPKDSLDETFELYSVPSYPTGIPEKVMGHEIGSSKQFVNEDNVLLCKINPRINRVWKVSKSQQNYRQIASTEWIVVENLKLNADYILYFLKVPFFRKLLTSNVTGVGGSLTRARPKEVENYPIPIPPLNEQKRIADKVERLLSKVDEAKKLIEEAKESFELRRAAILDKAFRGELTREWRRKNSNSIEGNYYINKDDVITNEDEEYSDILYALPNSWNWFKLKDFENDEQLVLTGPFGTSLGKKDFVNSGVPVLTIGCLTENGLSLEKANYVTEVKAKELSKYQLRKGDILFSRMATVGRASIVESDHINSIFNYHIMRVRLPQELNISYFLYVVKGSISTKRYLKKVNHGATRDGINTNELLNLPIPYPSFKEQEVIVEKINDFYKRENIVMEYVENCEKKLLLLKQSILSKAFKGELGTNEPFEENAIELLKEVLQEQSR
ncbi:restriction endonuclease subunit S [Halalkalibacter kiskunsagensis]|uniref:Restriction endonuclease subunit S n=1 Tax=Halalkalibacter kiskunsagensis TaxID=1548599 RepID=A0ABV6KLH1_9BACI